MIIIHKHKDSYLIITGKMIQYESVITNYYVKRVNIKTILEVDDIILQYAFKLLQFCNFKGNFRI